jgi:hypothetical protein
MPSNSIKTFCPFALAGTLKCLRYHAIPVDKSAISFLKASSSFHAYGSVTSFHYASLNAGASPPFESPTNTFQPGLKLYFTRVVDCANNPFTTITRHKK